MRLSLTPAELPLINMMPQVCSGCAEEGCGLQHVLVRHRRPRQIQGTTTRRFSFIAFFDSFRAKSSQQLLFTIYDSDARPCTVMN